MKDNEERKERHGTGARRLTSALTASHQMQMSAAAGLSLHRRVWQGRTDLILVATDTMIARDEDAEACFTERTRKWEGKKWGETGRAHRGI